TPSSLTGGRLSAVHGIASLLNLIFEPRSLHWMMQTDSIDLKIDFYPKFRLEASPYSLCQHSAR
ncbi:hypothetical protein BGZ73_001591, partial [Actinomortierella ambigua]